MSRVAAIDCGTNSIRLLIADISDGNFREIIREMESIVPADTRVGRRRFLKLSGGAAGGAVIGAQAASSSAPASTPGSRGSKTITYETLLVDVETINRVVSGSIWRLTTDRTACGQVKFQSNPRMNAAVLILIVLLLGVLIAAAWVAGIYNSLVTLRNRFRNAYAQIDVQLKRRYDLIPNLVSTVKASAQYEQDTLAKVVEARARQRGENRHRGDGLTAPGNSDA